MLKRVLIADELLRDAERIGSLLKHYDATPVICGSGRETEYCLRHESTDWAALIILWELRGPPRGFELVQIARESLPGVPVLVICDKLNADNGLRAFRFGARKVLQKPLDMEAVKRELDSLFGEQEPHSPLVTALNREIIGSSPAILETLKQIAIAIEHSESHVLIVGETGTGKELAARALHELGGNPQQPFTGVNVTATPKELIEGAIFGYERGAFTGAHRQHPGYMEEAGYGTLFFDEIGELELAVQVKLLRAIEERSFRRLSGATERAFNARLICATNRDLAQAIGNGTFRDDLFYRISGFTIEMPPLRERVGDIELLAEHFLSIQERKPGARLARETASMLRTYSFPGNVRQLKNVIGEGLMKCESSVILPQHLPTAAMDTLSENSQLLTRPVADAALNGHNDLFSELARLLPEEWRDMPYKQILHHYLQALDRIYFPYVFGRHDHNVTKSARAAGVDKKTFTQHLKDAEDRRSDTKSH